MVDHVMYHPDSVIELRRLTVAEHRSVGRRARPVRRRRRFRLRNGDR
jgi:hypothetical protein